MESPLDVLSRAASLIQQKEARIKMAVKNEANSDKDGSNDSGFEDNSSPPLKMSPPGEGKANSSLMARNSYHQEEMHGSPCDERSRSPEYLARRDPGLYAGSASAGEEIRPMVESKPLACLVRTTSDYHTTPEKKPRSNSPLHNETRETVIKPPITASGYPKFTSSAHKTTGHYGYPFLASYGMPLALMPRPSVITAAGSPSDFKAPSIPCYHCIQSSCCSDMKPLYNDRHQHAREMHSAIPSGFESPTVEDHFKKSLGPVYDRLSPRGHQYDRKASTTCLSTRTSLKELPPLSMPKTIPLHKEIAEQMKADFYHSASATPDHVYRDYALAPIHKRRHYRYDPIGRYSPEHLHGHLPPLRSYDHPGLKMDPRYLPRSLDEPCSVEEHFAKALGQIWFDVQGRGTEHVMRYPKKGLRVAHQ